MNVKDIIFEYHTELNFCRIRKHIYDYKRWRLVNRSDMYSAKKYYFCTMILMNCAPPIINCFKNMRKINFKKWLKTSKNILIISILNTIAILIFSYFWGNVGVIVSSNEIKPFKVFDNILHANASPSLISSDYVLVNTSHSLSLAPCTWNGGEGNMVITDRKELYEFLKIITEKINYRHILFDISLDDLAGSDVLNLEYTDSLVSLIKRTERITIANTVDSRLIDSDLYSKSANVNYYISDFSGDFGKIKLIDKSSLTMPASIYHSILGRNIKRAGPLYFDCDSIGNDCKLCHNILIPDYYIRPGRWSDNKNIEYGTYLEMASKEVLQTLKDIPEDYNDKIFVIGTFDNKSERDIHQTNVGECTGSTILVNSLDGLRRGRHLVMPMHICLLLIILYFVISVAIPAIMKAKLQNMYEKFIRSHRFIRLLIGFLGFGVFFSILSAFFGLCNDSYHYNAWIPTIWFTVYTSIIKCIEDE